MSGTSLAVARLAAAPIGRLALAAAITIGRSIAARILLTTGLAISVGWAIATSAAIIARATRGSPAAVPRILPPVRPTLSTVRTLLPRPIRATPSATGAWRAILPIAGRLVATVTVIIW